MALREPLGAESPDEPRRSAKDSSMQSASVANDSANFQSFGKDKEAAPSLSAAPEGSLYDWEEFVGFVKSNGRSFF